MTMPKWLNDISTFLPISTHFLVSGNVHDVYQVAGHLNPLEWTLWQVLKTSDFHALLLWRPFEGVSLYLQHGPRDPMVQQVRQALNLPQWPTEPSADDDKRNELNRLLEAWGRCSELSRMALMIDNLETEGTDEIRFALGELLERQMRMPGQRSIGPIFWISPNATRIPHGFAGSSDRIRPIVIPRPDLATRRAMGEILYQGMATSGTLQAIGYAEGADFASDLAAATHESSGLALRSIAQILARDADASPHMDGPKRLSRAVRRFQLGDAELSPWELPDLRDNIAGARDELNANVIGQTAAVEAVTTVLMRSFAGLSGAHVGKAGARPRGVLFFAGPTGVGKTEMAKTIAKIIFGDQDHYLRFDMSEFSQEHNVARLIGAPPGYVGFDNGGELVNAIRENPFRVILFDEIEKADRSILDKFLQILEDGRLTDGRGQTVHFSDCLIIFTSNLGMSSKALVQDQWVTKPAVSIDDDAQTVAQTIFSGVKNHFTNEINRPELFNRIGEQNIIIFQYIQSEYVRAIADKYLANIIRRLQEKSIILKLSDTAREQVYNACSKREVLELGGRGIGSEIETLLINELSRFLFDHANEASSTLTINAVAEGALDARFA